MRWRNAEWVSMPIDEEFEVTGGVEVDLDQVSSDAEQAVGWHAQ